jgi:hypothetical protein
MDSKKGQMYIGRDDETGEPVLLKASSLTTHGVVFGMTGSGKTGLGVNILEEAALNEIPTLILDPKGDMGNIMLNFPDTTPQRGAGHQGIHRAQGGAGIAWHYAGTYCRPA